MENCDCIEELTTLEEVKVIREGAGTDDYAALSNKPQINGHELQAGNNTLDDIGVQPKGNYATKDEIPNTDDFITKEVGNLTNYYLKTDIDSKLKAKADTSTIPSVDGFIKNTVDDLVNYYKKSETYTQTEINDKISAVKTGGFKKVDVLPESGEENLIYLVPATKVSEKNIKDEYIWLSDDQVFEKIGSTELNLDDYITTEKLNQKLGEYVTTASLTETLEQYAKTSAIPDVNDFITDAEVNAKLLTKADKSEIPSLENYYKKTETYSSTEVDQKIEAATGTDLSDYLKKEEASDIYLDKVTAGSTYATKGEIPDVKDFITETTADDKYASKTEIADFVTDEQVNTKLGNYLLTATADSTYAKVGDIADFITEANVDTKLEDYYTKQDIDGKGYLTKHQDISTLATKAEVNLKADKTDLDNYTDTETLESTYATKQEIPDTKSFITKEVADLTNYYDKDTTDGKITLKADKTYVDTNFVQKPEIADFIKKDVTDLENYYDKTAIDTKTENFITKAVDDLTNYYLKTETYNQTEIDQKISTVISGGFKKVEQLPKTGESKYIYLVPAEKTFSQNIKNEFIWLDEEQAFEQIGSTQLDLEPYATTEALNQKLLEYVTNTALEQKLSEYDKSVQVDSKIDEETRDLLKTLSRELKPDEEDETGYSAQTLVNVKNKSDATELIVEIDNLDVKTNVAVNSVLGTLKGQDLENRLKAVEGAGYITKEVSDLTNYYDQTTIDGKLDTKQPTGNYVLKTDIPTTTSKLTNDSGYIDKDVANLTNYYDSDTIDSKLAGKQATGNYALKSELPKVGTLDTTSTNILAESSTESLGGTVKLHKIAKSGSWGDLNNKPNLPSAISQLTNDWLMPGTDDENAKSLSTQNPNKFYYTVEEEA